MKKNLTHTKAKKKEELFNAEVAGQVKYNLHGLFMCKIVDVKLIFIIFF